MVLDLLELFLIIAAAVALGAYLVWLLSNAGK